MALNRHRPKFGLIGLALLILSLLGLVGPAPGHAQRAAETTYEYSFGQQARLDLKLPPSSPAEEARLFLRVNDELSRAYAVAVEAGQASHERSLREFPWPPFATITYWWEYAGETTPRAQFFYEDNRFRWQSHREEGITVYWVDGSTAQMIPALDIAQQARAEIESTLQAPPLETLSLYIYPALPDLQSALRLAGREWIAGQAYPDLNVVLLAIPATDEGRLQMSRDIPHEMAHQIYYNLVGDQGYAWQPTWLVEGLATHFEARPDPLYALTLREAREANRLLALETLCYPFPEARDQAILAYAQSQSLLNYLQRNYGWATIRALIHAYADGLDCSAGLEQTLGVDLPTFEREWRVWLERGAQPGAASSDPWTASAVVMLRDLAPWLTLLAITLLPGAIFALLLRLGR